MENEPDNKPPQIGNSLIDQYSGIPDSNQPEPANTLSGYPVSARLKNIFNRMGVQKIEDLSNYTQRDLRMQHNMGDKTMLEVLSLVTTHDISFKEQPPEPLPEPFWHEPYNLSVRLLNVLHFLDVYSLEDISKLSLKQVAKHRNVGIKTIEELKKLCTEAGIKMADDAP